MVTQRAGHNSDEVKECKSLRVVGWVAVQCSFTPKSIKDFSPAPH